MNTSKVRGFLLQSPKPHSVRLTGSELEDAKVIKVRNYSKAAETIEAIGAELVECLDSEGHLLRALKLTDRDAHRSDAAEIPAGIAADPQALMLTHFANLLHRAYEHSSEIAFNKLCEFVDIINQRTSSIEARLERTEAAHRRTVEEQVQDAYDRAEEIAEKAKEEGAGNGLADQLLGSFASGMLQPKPPARTNGAGNGAAKG